MFNPKSVRFRGPLTSHVEGFWSELYAQGYAPFSAANLLRLVAHLSRWLDDKALLLDDLTPERLAAFTKHRQRKGYTHFLTPLALQPLVAYLRGLGAVPPAPEPVVTPVDHLLREYGDYLGQERGLSESTIRGYSNFAQFFIAELFSDNVRDVGKLTAADVTYFVSRESQRSSVGKTKHTVTELRSLLRYLHVRGLLTRDLSSCVPAVAGWRLASLPKGLEPEEVEKMLGSRDTHTIVGCRDRAVLCLLVRLGLRTGEGARLCLEDFDWHAAELVVRGKGRRDGRLPLPHDVGDFIVAYLHRRPHVEHRAVFLCARAPHRPITPQAISCLAGRALRAVGVSTGSAHVLRHTAATQMLRGGASLAEVGHVLRHQHIATTAIYAKVDLRNLCLLARPWLGGVA